MKKRKTISTLLLVTSLILGLTGCDGHHEVLDEYEDINMQDTTSVHNVSSNLII
jgi:hypothetical protein